jgi:lipid II:glycine glycyltransferase (peptidoglycan interpeptide bridge formation enzyme)
MFNFYNFKDGGAQLLYKKFLLNTGKKLPHFVIEYLNNFCIDINLGCFFVFENESTESFVVMPGYLRDIKIGEGKTDYKDFISPYGYYGPFSSINSTEQDSINFWNHLDNWYADHKIVSEFVRFGLDENFKGYSGHLVPTLTNIKGKIIQDDEQWSNFEHKVRKNVKKAQREGLSTGIYFRNITAEIIETFYRIYIHTMERTNAKNSFFYTKDNFSNFIFNNSDLCAIAIIQDQDVSIAAELLLVSDDSIYSFLGGTISDYFDKRPNDLLKFEVINWARKNNIKYFILGGGYGADDGIYKYKKSFFPNDSVTYYTGRKIMNDQIYRQLLSSCNRERKKYGIEELSIDDESFFPLYRKVT